MIRILGISAFYHDSAAALIDESGIVAAAQEERFSRIKHDQSFPDRAVGYCLKEAGIGIDEIDCVAFYENTHLKFDRILRTYVHYLPRSFYIFKKALKVWLKQKLFLERLLIERLGRGPAYYAVPHHLSHAASAFYPSPFDEAAVLVVDGVGEWACTSMGVATPDGIRLIKEIRYPDSLGILYSAFTQYVGFRVNSGEYKMMGLAPYGRPRYKARILTEMLDLKDDGSYRLDLQYFRFHYGETTINHRFERFFGFPARKANEPVREIDLDVSASIQAAVEEIVIRLAKTARRLSGSRHLVIGGGVGLNCCANGVLEREGIFKRIWVQPAAGDAGGALGAALTVFHEKTKQPKTDRFQQLGSLFGPEYSTEDIREILDRFKIAYEAFTDEAEFMNCVAAHIARERVVGWFQGRMEFGPRALGSRSIIGSAHSERLHREMNLKIKYRESFRPFAPAVLEEDVGVYFERNDPSPYMLFVNHIHPSQRCPEEDGETKGLEKLKILRSNIPAVTHVDYSARIQTVSPRHNGRFYRLLKAYKALTGHSVVINTSFNVRGEPIVRTPRDALRCFFSCEMEILAMDNFIISKENQKIEHIGAMFLRPEQLEF